MPTISKDTTVATLINVFTVEPGNLQEVQGAEARCRAKDRGATFKPKTTATSPARCRRYLRRSAVIRLSVGLRGSFLRWRASGALCFEGGGGLVPRLERLWC